eukprot:2575131-Pleurochrysis_carterae.AAC.1
MSTQFHRLLSLLAPTGPDGFFDCLVSPSAKWRCAYRRLRFRASTNHPHAGDSSIVRQGSKPPLKSFVCPLFDRTISTASAVPCNSPRSAVSFFCCSHLLAPPLACYLPCCLSMRTPTSRDFVENAQM